MAHGVFAGVPVVVPTGVPTGVPSGVLAGVTCVIVTVATAADSKLPLHGDPCAQQPIRLEPWET